jgi:CHAT domain-containing protein/Tfp pilus assembly protein PilF
MSIRSRILGVAIPCLLLAPLAPASPAAEETPTVRFKDDFTMDTRKDYQVMGEVAWRKGVLMLSRDARIIRKLELGYTSEVRAELRWDKDQRDGELRLGLADDKKRAAGVLLRLVKGKTMLIVPVSPAVVVALDGPGDKEVPEKPVWVVRLKVSYGLLHTKAWRLKSKEPKDWQSLLYLGASNWQPQWLALGAGPSGGGSLKTWTVRGCPPLVFSKEQGQQLQRVGKLNDEMMTLLRHNRIAEAATLGREIVAIERKALPEGHPDIALSLNNLALYLEQLGQHAEAKTCFEEALDIQRKTLPEGHPDIAASLDCLGTCLPVMGQHARARACLEEALDIRRKVLPKGDPSIAASLNNLGMLLRNIGQHARARDCYKEALDIARKAFPKGHSYIAASLHNLGNLHLDMGQHAEARACYEEALTIARKARPKGDPLIAITLGGLGTLLQDMGDSAGALRHFQEAVSILADHTARTAAGTAQREHIAIGHQHRYLLGIFLSLAEQTAALSDTQRQRVLESVLDGKAISSVALTTRQEAVLLEQQPEAMMLLNRLRPLRQRLADLLLQGSGRLSPERYRDLCDDLRKEHDELERNLALRVQDYATLRRARQAGPHALARQLAPNSALVELVRHRRYDLRIKAWLNRPRADHYLAVLLWREAGKKAQPQVRLVPLGEANPIDQAIHAWRTHAQTGTIDDKSDRELRRRLWAPLAKALPEKTTRLFIAPDGELALLPFEAIRETNGKYLVERLQISYLTTGRDLMPRPQPKKKSDLALVLADPDYNALGAQDKPLAKAKPVPPKRNDDWTRQMQFKPLESLEGFRREADAVEKLLQERNKDWHVQSCRGSDASEETLRSVSRPRLLYCITHGFFLQDRPRPATPDHLLRELGLADAGPSKWRLPDPGPDPRLASGLALAGANRWQQRSKRGISDGLLTALEAEDLDLWGTELVVLSACDTGRGQVQVGEGVLGLRRAFQQAGAQTVLASLWKVPDAETEQLMTAFLRRWLGGADKSEALRQAQLELIRRLREGKDKDKRTAPPLYWAAFICHGQHR